MTDDADSRRCDALRKELRLARQRVAELERELLQLEGTGLPAAQESGLHYLEDELYSLVRTDPSIFQFLQGGSLDGIWYWDLESPEHEWMSPEFWELFGYAPDEKKHLASEWQDMIFAEDLQTALDNFTIHCADPDHPYDQVVRYRHKDGSTVWVRCRGLAIRDETGKPVRMLGAHNDLTEQMRADEAQHLAATRYRQLVENASSVILELDTQGVIRFVNSHGEKIFGYSKDEILGKNIVGLIVPRIESTGRDLAAMIRKIVTTPEEYEVNENENLCKDGSRRWLHWSNKALRDEQGHVLGVLGVGTDITRRKKAERALELSRERFRTLVENMPVMIHAHDAKRNVVFWNNESQRVLGYTAEEMINNPRAMEKLYPDPAYRRYVLTRLHDERVEFRDVELIMRAKDGSDVVVNWSNISPSCPVPGWPVWEVGRDVTARKQAQQALEESEAKYRLLADNAADVIWTMDPFHNVTYISPSIEKLVGYGMDEYLALSLEQRYSPESCALIRERIARRQQNWRNGIKDLAPSKIEVEHYTKSGGSIWVEMHSRPIVDERGELRGMVGVARDVSDRKKMTEALQQSETRYRILFEKASEGVLLHDLEGNILEANQAALEMFGYTLEELQALHPSELVHPDEAAEVAEDFKTIQRNELSSRERRYLRKDGQEIILIVKGKLVAADLIQGVMRDVTLQRRQQERLRLLTRAMEQSAEAIIITDAKGGIQYVNPHFSKVTGYTLDEVLGKNPSLLSSGYHSREFYQKLWQRITSGKTWSGEILNRKKGGETYWEHASISPVVDERGAISHFVAVKLDISERKRLEQVKEDVERIIRHDLKSPLVGIISMPELLLASPFLAEDQRDMLRMIKESGQKMLGLINSSFTLYRIETGEYTLQPEPFNCLKALDAVFADCRDVILFKEIQLKVLLDGKPVPAGEEVVMLCDVELMPFVLSNLVKNALEAAPFCSEVTVEFLRGDPFRFAVHNAGRVPETIAKRFFEKYATFGKSHGTGLGTYSARLVARAHGGEVTLQTSEAAGTTVTVSIPQSVP